MRNKADERQRNQDLAKLNAENQSKLDILKEQTKGDKEIEELKSKNSQELEKIKAESQEKPKILNLGKMQFKQ